MKNLRNLLKKLTVVTLLTAVLFIGSLTALSPSNHTDNVTLPLGDSLIRDIKEY